MTPGYYSIGDIYMAIGADFLQMGFYVGNATKLPYETYPRMFVGEYAPNETNDEILRPGPYLGWGTYHTFEITFTSTPNKFDFILNGQRIASTVLGHSTYWQPGFVGELVSSDCRPRMSAKAAFKNAPTRTLLYKTTGAGTYAWHFFSDFRHSNHPSIIVTSAGDIATAYAYGGCVC